MSSASPRNEPAAPADPPPGSARAGGLVRVGVDRDGELDRYRLDLAYDGSDFSGWATQPGRRTVQESVELALGRVLRLADRPRLVVAGRTDAGVHATGQVAHVDLPATPEVERLRRGLNGVLPPDVRIRRFVPAPTGFDARFSAVARRYVYRVTDTVADPLRRHDTLSWPRPLDAVRMQQAAAALLGEQDFAAFCKKREGATTIRRLLRLDCHRDAGVLCLTVEADAFCHSMVRALTGALLAVGEGRRPPDWPGEVLHGRVRSPSVAVAPAHGLPLIEVRYPPDDQPGARAEVTRRVRTPRS